MTAGLIIAALTALFGAGATAGAIAFAYALWKDSNAIKDRFLDSEDNRRRLLADKGALTQQLADRDREVAGARATTADLAARLKVAEARAVAALPDDRLRDVVNGVPAHGGGAGPAAVPGSGHAGPATALPDSLPTRAPGSRK